MKDLTSDVQEAPEIFFRPALEQDLDIINRLEADGYPEDEAASPLQMEYRLKHAPEFFLCCEKSNEGVVGYVCGTLAPPGNNRLSEETMSSHHPDGTALCIHSVCVHKNNRRKGIATKLLRAYARYVAGSSPNVEVKGLLAVSECLCLVANIFTIHCFDFIEYNKLRQ